MTELRPKPNGSEIEEIDDFDGQTYHWKPPSDRAARAFLIPFAIVMACGWLVGFVFASLMLMKNIPGPPGIGPPNGFLATWLTGWILGGGSVLIFFYLSLRPGNPESITLGRNFIRHNPGSAPNALVFISPFIMTNAANPFAPFTRLWKRRKTVEVAKAELGPFVLARVGERQRLTFDHGADRIEIGEHLREPDREWLAAVIQEWMEN